MAREMTSKAGSTAEDIFAEMEPFTVKASDVDYSRDSLYSRQQGE